MKVFALNNHWCMASGTSIEVGIAKEALSVKHPQEFMMRKRNPKKLEKWDGRIKLWERTGDETSIRFRSGLTQRLATALKVRGGEVSVEGISAMRGVDARPSQAIKARGFTLDDDQLDALKALFSQRIASLEFATGSGKTIVAACAMQICNTLFGWRFAFVVPRKNLLAQATKDFRKATTLKIARLGAGYKELEEPHDVLVVVADSARIYAKDLQGYNGLLLDECLPYDVPVQTELGETSIGDIVTKGVAKFALSRNEKGVLESKPIISRTITGVRRIWEVTVLTDTGKTALLRITGNGRVWTTEGYVRIDQLSQGQKVCHVGRVRAGALQGTVIGVVETDRFEPTFDIGVADNHNFFAGGILVHNCHHVQAESWLSVVDSMPGVEVLWGLSGKVTYESSVLKELRIESVFGKPVFQGRSPVRQCAVHLIQHSVGHLKNALEGMEVYSGLVDGVPALARQGDKWVQAVWRGADAEGVYPEWMYELVRGKPKLIKEAIGVYPVGASGIKSRYDSDDVTYLIPSDLGIMACRQRNEWALGKMQEFADRSEPFLATVRRRKHLLRLKAMASRKWPELKLGFIDGTVKGKDQTNVLDSLRQGRLDGIVAVYQTVTEGTDVPSLVHLLKLDGIADEQVLEQQKGRVERVAKGKKEAFMHIPMDPQHKKLASNAKQMVKYLSKRCASVRKCDDPITGQRKLL